MLFVFIIAQFSFTLSDLLARANLAKTGFGLQIIFESWFPLYILLRILATAGQLYIFSSTELGKTMALFGAGSIVMSSILGFLLLKELLSFEAYIGIFLAVSSIAVLALAK